MKIDEAKLASLPPEARTEVEKALAEVKAAYDDNPLLRFEPHPGQIPYLEITTNIGAAFCGNRFGKTAIGLVWDLIQSCDREAVPKHLLRYKRWDPPVRGRIVAPKFNENIEQVILPELRKWAPRSQLAQGQFDKAFRKQARVLEFANGSTIQFLTFDQDLDAHAGAALHWCHFDEEPEGEKGLQMFHENMTRLGDHDGDFRLTMTPLFGLSWAYDEIWLARLHDDDITAIQGDSYSNPHVSHERLKKDERRMTREEIDARRRGKFVHFAGQFYPEFGDEHRVPRPKPEHVREQAIICGIDPGLNYTGVVWVAFDSDNVALLFEELEAEQLVVDDVAKKIHETNRLWGIEPDYYVIDPSARNRTLTEKQKIETAYLRAGIPTVHGQNDRGAGILEVKARLQHGPGLFVSEECPRIGFQFERYRRDPNSKDEFAAVAQGANSRADLLDALRYVCMERLWVVTGDDPDYAPDDWVPGTAPAAEWLDGPQPSHPLGACI